MAPKQTERRKVKASGDLKIHPLAATGEESSVVPVTGMRFNQDVTSNVTEEETEAKQVSPTSAPALADKYLSSVNKDFLPFLIYLVVIFGLAIIDSWQKQFEILAFTKKALLLLAVVIGVLILYGLYRLAIIGLRRIGLFQ